MIDETVEILSGMTVVHDEGLRYEVEDTRSSTNNYEMTHQVGAEVVNYVQLEDGGFPAGTKWNKDEEEFRKFFTLEAEPDDAQSEIISAEAEPAIDITNPGPNAALYAYFIRVSAPAPEEVIQAADSMGAAYRELEHTQDALNVCADLARDVPQATTVLAAMIGTGHEAVPKRWRRDPDDIRMVLSMVGHMEIGFLRAQQTAVRRGPALPELSERIVEIERLIDSLQ